jgi:hypothetical protein
VQTLKGGCTYDLTIEIGGVPIQLRTSDSTYFRMLQDRYLGFINLSLLPAWKLEIKLVPHVPVDSEERVRVTNDAGWWYVQRSDFQATLDVRTGEGWITQPAHPYATDCVLRIWHTVLLAGQGGFLLHSASALRNGRAHFFFGRSGAGKSTMLRMAPADVTLLTDEVSYLRRDGETFIAHGTPFTGDLERLGDNVSAPLCALYDLVQGGENRFEPIPLAEAVNALLSSVLFFSNDLELVKSVFHSACDLVARIPVRRLTFLPDARVWELIA